MQDKQLYVGTFRDIADRFRQLATTESWDHARMVEGGELSEAAGTAIVECSRRGWLTGFPEVSPLVSWLDGKRKHPAGMPPNYVRCALGVFDSLVGGGTLTVRNHGDGTVAVEGKNHGGELPKAHPAAFTGTLAYAMMQTCSDEDYAAWSRLARRERYGRMARVCEMLADAVDRASEPDSDSKDGTADDRIAVLLKNDPYRRWTVPDLADKAHCSTRTVKRSLAYGAWKKASGQPRTVHGGTKSNGIADGYDDDDDEG